MSGRILRSAFLLLIVVVWTATSSVVEAKVTEDGLVSYWRFDKEDIKAGSLKALRGENLGKLVGNPVIAEGKVGSALAFDGIDDYVEVADHESLHLWKTYTLEAWIYLRELKSVRILDKITANTNDGLHLDTYPGDRLRSCAGKCISSKTALQIETWLHIALTFDNGNVTFYLNGEQDGKDTVPSPLKGNALPLRIGADSNGEHLFNGLIDEVRIYNRALSPAEVKGNFSTQEELAKDKDSKIKPYKEVITEEAESKTGVFAVHKVKNTWYYEIPKKELGRLFLWVSQIAKNQTRVGFGGQAYNNMVVRWDRRDDKILLRQIQYRIVADEEKAVYNAVSAATFPPILEAFDIKAIGEDESAVIDVTGFFTSDTTEFSPKQTINAEGLDEKRSFVERISPYQENIETEVVLTFKAKSAGGDRRLGTISVVMHHSMVHLPEKPMMSRLADSRVGYFTVTQEDYGMDTHRAEQRQYITRWRLEKKDPDASLSEPVSPIVFYIDRTVPEKWRPYLKQGVEDWQPAFEQAGFKNAIIGKYAPSVEEDPEWSTEDARISSISWLPSTIENAFGPHVHDPRTGEILEADVKFFHNVMKLARDWYFVQVGCLDPRAETLPLPDELMGELLRYITAHEVGHSLGLPHNMKASSSYPVEKLRSAEFTEKYGHVASIMDYARFNYVAQPGDNARLIPIVGPYDKFSIEWGYKPIPDATTPDEEKSVLHELASMQSEDPILRFGHGSYIDPSAQSEDVGADPIAATTYGLKNIDRIADMLVPATTTQPGEDYSELQNMYHELINQRNRELRHVIGLIGGVVKTDYHIGQEGMVYEAVPREKQREAMQFLLENAFTTPTKLLNPDILERIEPTGNVNRVTGAQIYLLRELLREDRAQRLIDQEAKADPDQKAYGLEEMLSDLRLGLWGELEAEIVAVGPYRRLLQRAHIEELGTKLDSERGSRSDMRPLARGELKSILEMITSALERATDRTTQLHLEDMQMIITHTLDPRK